MIAFAISASRRSIRSFTLPRSNWPVLAPPPRRDARQDLDPLADRLDRIDMKAPLPDRVDDILSEHQVLGVARRDQHALVALQPLRLAHVEEALDLLVDPADRLDLALLVHGAGHGERLLDRQVREGGQDRVQFCARGAITLDTALALLEHESAGEAQGLVPRGRLGEGPGGNQTALRVDLPAPVRLPPDVDDS